MSNEDLDQLRLSYKEAVNEWVDAIHAAHFREEDAHTKATEAREAYKDGLRGVNYGI